MMEKALTDRIAQRQLKKQSSGNSKNNAAFLTHKKEIARALSDNWSMKVIWETLIDEKKISFSYKTFRVYVSKHIQSEKSSTEENTKEDKTVESKAENQIKGFTYNPKANLEEFF
jgi:hypothetical protein